MISSHPKGFNPGNWNFVSQCEVSFMEMLKFAYFSKLANDRMCHNPNWPLFLTKLSLDILKFEGKASEDPRYHEMAFLLFFSSNSLMDDSVRLILF
jgi:hypothetical protein